MENNFTPTSNSNKTKKNASADVVKQLQVDRQGIAQRATLPTWFHPVLAFVAVTYVIAPAMPGGREQNSGFIFAFVATIVLIYVAQKKTGIKLGDGGPKGWLIFAAMLATIITGLIVALGLVSFGLNWWVVAPASAVFVVIFALSKLYEKTVKEQITRER